MRSRAWTWVAGAIVLVVVGFSLLTLALQGGGNGSPAPPTPAVSPTPTARSVPSPTAPAPTPTPAPLVHVVQPGETLGGIAAMYGVPLEELIAANGLSDPNLIHAGQELIIPGRTAPSDSAAVEPTAVPPPIPTPLPPATPTPEGPPRVEIAAVVGAGDLEVEQVRVRNTGGMAVLEGWALSSADGERFVFPRLVLFSGGEVTVYSRSGQNTPTSLYWGREEPAWASGEMIVLEDSDGAVVDTYLVP
ncbi:MAG TPA: LysM peptidoglycan-binding domain-containing protein [Chloroflexi bacterium]|nr:LysM peptidoglycan-binding domain-containing protein [Chloroflexota bacterium]